MSDDKFHMGTHDVPPTDDMSKTCAKQLRDSTLQRQDTWAEQAEGPSSGPAAKPVSILSATASALVNFLMMFGLCSAFGVIMFEDDWNTKHRGLSVKMNLCTALVMGLWLAAFSKVGVAVGGPDPDPVLFLSMFVQNIAKSVASQRGLSLPSSDGRRLLGACGAMLDLDPPEALRRLAGAADVEEFCVGRHYAAHAADCDKYHDELRATTVFAVAVSSLLLAVVFFCLGRFRMTRLVSYVPSNIMEAFLSCVGYKVFMYALKFCKYKPRQFVPAACVGVPLYFLKTMRVGNPAVVLPLVMLIPLAVFYAIVYGSGGSLATARSAGWMFEEVENVDFWLVWTDSLGKAGDINFEAWSTTLVDLAVMVLVVVLDCMLKLSSTESKLPVKVDMDYEIQLYGLGNFLTSLCGSSVGYMQLKFNILNYEVVGNVKDRRAAAMYALLCGAVFFWSTDLFNYLPRFFLSTLLFYSGSSFVVENLWGSRKYLSSTEWSQIFLILAVFILADSLLYAVIVGCLITGATFIIRYSNVPCVIGKPMYGCQGQFRQRRGVLTQQKIQHVANSWMLVIRLKGYIFFASAQKLVGGVVHELEQQRLQGLPHYQRVHYLIIDCTQLDGLDASASKAFGQLAMVATALNVQILWSGTASEFVRQLKLCGTITDDSQLYDSLLEAKHHVEVAIQRYLVQKQEAWLELHPLFGLVHGVLTDRMAMEPFEDILRLDASRLCCPWKYCSRLKIKAFSTVLWEANQRHPTLFLVHSGKVGMFTSMPSESADTPWQPPVVVYGRGALLNCEALLERPTRLHAVALEDGELLCWSKAQWKSIVREEPAMAEAILKAVLRQGDTSHEGSAELLEPTGFLPLASNEHVATSSEATKLREAIWEDLGPYLQGLHSARGLGALGLFNADDSATVRTLTPFMMEVFQRNLLAAFNTYADVPSVDDDEESSVWEEQIPADRIGEALVFAGLYGLVLTESEMGSLTESEFMNLGFELALAKFSALQVQKVKDLFKQRADADNCMDRAGVIQLLRQEVHPGLSVDRVDDLISLCAGAAARSVGEVTFVAMMSRLVRKHELDWSVLLGLRHLLGFTESAALDDRLTPEMLVQNGRGRQLTLEEAEELIWTVNLVADLDGASLDIRMVVLALWPIDIPRVALSFSPIDARDGVVPSCGQSSESTGICSEASGAKGIALESYKRVFCHRVAAAKETLLLEFEDDCSEDVAQTEQPPDTCRVRLHLLLDHPESSHAASRWSVLMGMLIMVSVLTLVTRPIISPVDEPMDATEEAVWETFEIVFTALFTMEYLARFSVANALGNQTLVGFLRSPMNICDVVAILPWYVDAMVGSSAEGFLLFRVARLMRLARLARLGRLANKSAAFAPIAMILVVIWGIFMKTNL